jgi:hypothetical protein
VSGFNPEAIRVGVMPRTDLIITQCLLPGCGWTMTFSFGAQRLSTITEVCEQHPCRRLGKEIDRG